MATELLQQQQLAQPAGLEQDGDEEDDRGEDDERDEMLIDEDGEPYDPFEKDRFLWESFPEIK